LGVLKVKLAKRAAALFVLGTESGDYRQRLVENLYTVDSGDDNRGGQDGQGNTSQR
jgi:hypothetical protein